MIRQLTFWDHIDRMYIRKPYTCSVSMVTEKKKIDIIDLNHEISLYWRIVREKTKNAVSERELRSVSKRMS